MKFKVIVKAYDSWIGSYVNWKDGYNVMYLFFLPIIGLRIEWKSKKENSTQLNVMKLYAIGLVNAFIIFAAWVCLILFVF